VAALKLPVFSQAGEKVDEIEASEAVFGVKEKTPLVHAAVVSQLANGRQGSSDTKTRGEVAGGGRKPWRQKGTGRARHGSIRSPLWRGGGIVFGPHPRSYAIDLPKQARREALRAALSAKAREGAIMILESLAFSEPKTRALVEVLGPVAAGRSALIVTAGPDRNVVLSSRNLPGVRAIEARNLNVYDVVKHERVLFTREALGRVEEALQQ
jgi:large subunit ribosomal protein L4